MSSIANLVTIEGNTKDELIELKRFVRGKNGLFDFSQIVPVPAGIDRVDRLPCYFREGWENASVGEWLEKGTSSLLSKKEYNSTIRECMKGYVQYMTKGKAVVDYDENLFSTLMMMLECKLDSEKFEQVKKSFILSYRNVVKFGIPNGREWRWEKWGVENNADFAEISDGIEEKKRGSKSYYAMTYNFDTGDNIPYNVIEALAEKFKNLKIKWRYASENYGHMTGGYLFKGNKVVQKKYKEGSEYAVLHSMWCWGEL